MPKAEDLMERREEEVYNTLLSLSEKTRGFTDPELVVTGGYALRAFTRFSSQTRPSEPFYNLVYSFMTIFLCNV